MPVCTHWLRTCMPEITWPVPIRNGENDGWISIYMHEAGANHGRMYPLIENIHTRDHLTCAYKWCWKWGLDKNLIFLYILYTVYRNTVIYYGSLLTHAVPIFVLTWANLRDNNIYVGPFYLELFVTYPSKVKLILMVLTYHPLKCLIHKAQCF